MNYLDMTNEQLSQEIIRVRNLALRPNNSHTYHQNKKYLVKLEREWRLRNES